MITIETRASHLSNVHLDALIEQHIFGRDLWCNGYCEYQYQSGRDRGIYKCTICGGIEERVLSLHYIEGHSRVIPHYTESRANARQIIDAIEKWGKTVQSCFTLNLCCFCPAGQSMLVWELFGATARQIAIAALQAVDVVDREGYLVVQEKAS